MVHGVMRRELQDRAVQVREYRCVAPKARSEDSQFAHGRRAPVLWLAADRIGDGDQLVALATAKVASLRPSASGGCSIICAPRRRLHCPPRSMVARTPQGCRTADVGLAAAGRAV